MAKSKRKVSLSRNSLCDADACRCFVVCIGAALQAIRKLQGHNQNWLARRLSDSLELNEKVEQSYISQVERGKKGISMENPCRR